MGHAISMQMNYLICKNAMIHMYFLSYLVKKPLQQVTLCKLLAQWTSIKYANELLNIQNCHNSPTEALYLCHIWSKEDF